MSSSSLLKKVFEVSRWATLIQDPSARRTKDSQPSGFGFEYCASHVRFRVFQQTARADTLTGAFTVNVNPRLNWVSVVVVAVWNSYNESALAGGPTRAKTPPSTAIALIFNGRQACILCTP